MFQQLAAKLLEEHDSELAWLPTVRASLPRRLYPCLTVNWQVQWQVLAAHAQWLEQSSNGTKKKLSVSQREVVEGLAKGLMTAATRHFTTVSHRGSGRLSLKSALICTGIGATNYSQRDDARAGNCRV